MAARREGVDPHITELLDKARQITISQLADVDTVLLDMGIGGTHPQRDYLRVMVLQALASNYQAVVAKSNS